MSSALFTIGHSTHTVEHFMGLLERHRIEAICDVRSVPYSQRNPQFNRESLKEKLRATGISYAFLGKELGARSDNSACYIDGKIQYNYLVEEPIFQAGLERVRKGMEKFRLALMCAERDPLTCHRTILVCRELRTPDLLIEHILADGNIETGSSAEERLMAMMNVRPDLLHGEHECVEQAYEMQARNIAYVMPTNNLHPTNCSRTDEDLYDRLHE